MEKKVKELDKRVEELEISNLEKELSEGAKRFMENYQSQHQWEPWTPEEISEALKNNLKQLSEFIQDSDTDKCYQHTVWEQSFDGTANIWTSVQPIIDKVEQYFISPKKKDPKGTVTFTTPKGTLLRAFNYQDKGVLYNVEDVEKLLETDVIGIDLAKDTYGYIPVIGNSMCINANRFAHEVLKSKDSKLCLVMLIFFITKVEEYMKNNFNFLEPGTEVFIPHKTGVVLKGKITARNENAPNPVIYSAEFLLRDKIVANTEFSSDDINIHVFLKP